jgi:hypothetical protein
MYYASAVDCSSDCGKTQLKFFKALFKKYPQIKVIGAGIGESPIISLESSMPLKKAIVAYDLRKLRECDILLMVTDLKTYCAGTHMELEYARNLGLLTIVLCLPDFVYSIKNNDLRRRSGFKDKVKNIFIETMADRVIYTIEELEEILEEITK